MLRLLLLPLLATGCSHEGPLGIVDRNDGITYAGVAAIDITPEVVETFTDLDGDGTFDGCIDDVGCAEPFDDVDGDGWFDAVFIGGFGFMRPAQGVHDPIWARAVVIAQDGEYLALVALDLVGLGSPTVQAARLELIGGGFDGNRLLVAPSHNHEGPDTMGLWGNPLHVPDPISGMDPDYQARVAWAIEQSVREAAAQMVPVELEVASTRMRDRGRWLSGPAFGGDNPDAIFHGMIHDGRDPVVVSDQLLVAQGVGEDGEAVFTLTSWSGHPETWGSENNLLSSDWVGVTREVLEAEYGGVALHVPECLGGMQSALHGWMPLVEEDGTHLFQTCDAAAVADPDDPGCHGKSEGEVRTTDDGEPVPEWAEQDSWEFARSHGWHIAEAAIDALDEAGTYEAAPIRVETEPVYVPIENALYQLLGPSGIFDLDLDDAVEDLDKCPEAAAGTPCIQTTTSRVTLGPIGLIAIPGEVLPELAWGFPTDDPAWLAEVADPTARGEGSTYFPQHDHDCDELAYADCTTERSIGDCSCTRVHAWPYTLSPDPSVPPLLDLLDTEHRAVLGMANDYLSYVVPEPDFNTWVSAIGPEDGDHYEDTVSPAHNFATRVQEAQLVIDARW